MTDLPARARVVVIGGGVIGLSTALALQDALPAHQLDPPFADPRQLRVVAQIVHDLVAAPQHRADIELAAGGLRGAGYPPRLRQDLRRAQQRLRGHARIERALSADQLALHERHARAPLR